MFPEFNEMLTGTGNRGMQEAQDHLLVKMRITYVAVTIKRIHMC